MAIIKSRPRVRVRVPNEIRPGDRFGVVVLLDCRRPLEIEGVSITLVGVERWATGSGDSRRSGSRTFVGLGATLCGERELPAGRTELNVHIPLPPESPPTFHGAAAHIGYTLAVHVEIDWWPDRRAEFEIFVAPPPVASPPSEPQVYSSDPKGPRGREPHVELGLASAWTRAGATVSGALALTNVAHNRYSEIHVGVCGTETIYEGSRVRSKREHLCYRIRIGAEEAREGEMMPFGFRLPKDAMAELPWTTRPDGEPGLSSLEWQLEVVVGIRWGRDLTIRVPFRVLPASSRKGDVPSRLAPPTVGSDRLREIWRAVGEPHGLRYDAQTLYGGFGGTTLAIRRDLMGREGIFLIAELTYAPLHLDLEVVQAVGIQRTGRVGVRIGDPSWDREHYVQARDEQQAVEVLRAIAPFLANATLRRLDDERMTLAVRGTGASRSIMQGFVSAAIELAEAFEAVREALPPPTPMRGAVDTWRALASRLDAPLETARMRVEGRLADVGAEVRVAFDERGQPLSTWVAVMPDSAIDREYHLTVTASEAANERIEQAFGGETLELVKQISHGANEFAIERSRICICLPRLLGAPDLPSPLDPIVWPSIPVDARRPLTTAETERTISRLARLVVLLRTQAGPYR